MTAAPLVFPSMESLPRIPPLLWPIETVSVALKRNPGAAANVPAELYWTPPGDPPGLPVPAEQGDHASASDPLDDKHWVPLESPFGSAHTKLLPKLAGALKPTY